MVSEDASDIFQFAVSALKETKLLQRKGMDIALPKHREGAPDILGLLCMHRSSDLWSPLPSCQVDPSVATGKDGYNESKLNHPSIIFLSFH